MNLLLLEPEYVRHERRVEEYTVVVGDPLTWQPGDPTRKVTGPREYTPRVKTLAEAHGLFFLCPRCFQANGGPVGTHGVLVTFEGRGAPAGSGSRNSKGDIRWRVSGSCFEDLTVEPSILIKGGGCDAHFFIRNGVIDLL